MYAGNIHHKGEEGREAPHTEAWAEKVLSQIVSIGPRLEASLWQSWRWRSSDQAEGLEGHQGCCGLRSGIARLKITMQHRFSIEYRRARWKGRDEEKSQLRSESIYGGLREPGTNRKGRGCRKRLDARVNASKETKNSKATSVSERRIVETASGDATTYNARGRRREEGRKRPEESEWREGRERK